MTEHPRHARHSFTGEPLYAEDFRPLSEQARRHLQQRGCEYCGRVQPVEQLVLLVPSPERMATLRHSSALPRFPGSEYLPPWPVCDEPAECLEWHQRRAADQAVAQALGLSLHEYRAMSFGHPLPPGTIE